MFQRRNIKKTIMNMDAGERKAELGIWPLPVSFKGKGSSIKKEIC
jgi:hypothetical protein